MNINSFDLHHKSYFINSTLTLLLPLAYIYARINFPLTATSEYLRSAKQYLISQLESVVSLNYNLVVRPLLRPDIGAAAEVEPVLKLQQSPLSISFLEDELLLSYVGSSSSFSRYSNLGF